jgi:hypothetical protein
MKQNKFIRALLLFLPLIFICHSGIAQNEKIPVKINNDQLKYDFIGELGEKLGTMLTVRGFICDGEHKGFESGPCLLVQMINEKCIQQFIQIPVSPYFGEFGEQLPRDFGKLSEKSLPKLENLSTYSFRVYETGAFVGIPGEAYSEAGIALQMPGFYFQNKLIVVSGEKTDSIVWSPAQFIGREALLSGTAKNENDQPVIHSSKWKLILKGSDKWTDANTGKLAEVYGKIQQDQKNGFYYVENCQPRLVKLKDQLGKKVKLRGAAWSMNGYWWFNYRGANMYVENMEKLPGWTGENHGSEIEISGTLEQASLPDLDEITTRINPGLKTYFIVRQASWSPIDGLLTAERSYR